MSARPSGVVVTGVGAVTPLGHDLDASWTALLAGEIALRADAPHLAAPLRRYPVGLARLDEALAAAEAAGDGIAESERRKLDPVSQAALLAGAQALRQAGMPQTDAVIAGVGYGATTTHLRSTERVHAGRADRLSPFTIPASMPNAPAAQLALRFGVHGPALTVATACASGLDAIGQAWVWLAHGSSGCVLAGGAEMIADDLGVGGMAAARALAAAEDGDVRVLRPFDRARGGTAVGSGAAFLVMEKEEQAAARGARVLARVDGYGCSADAHHVTAPDPEGRGAERAMRDALNTGSRAEVDAVFAHGTGTPRNDAMEGAAIARVFAERGGGPPAVTSTKGQYGHAMGASGAINAAFAARAVQEGILPATLPCDDPDPECAVRPVTGEASRMPLSRVMVNAFGFGGHNASVVVAGPDAGSVGAGR